MQQPVLLFFFTILFLFSFSTYSSVSDFVIVEDKEYDTGQFNAEGEKIEYRQLTGYYTGELAPNDSQLNEIITDYKLAEKLTKPDGTKVIQYKSKFVLLKPVEKGNESVLYEFNNRGNRYANYIYNMEESNNQMAPGDGFLFREGYAVLWSGVWGDVKQDAALSIELPLAKKADGSSIEGKIWDECSNNFWIRDSDQDTCKLAYHIADGAESEVELWVRDKREDTPRLIPSNQWRLIPNGDTGRKAIWMINGRKFINHKIYQAIYKARDPQVMGLGFVAVRDLMSFLRNDTSEKNPLKNRVKYAYSSGLSQAGRASREFVYLGLNKDPGREAGKIFDGMQILVAGGMTYANFRFGQPVRIPDFRHRGLYYPNYRFPFTYGIDTEPTTQEQDGILKRCMGDNTCPKILHTVSALENWALRGSLVHTNPEGTKDAVIPENVRLYHMTGVGHWPFPLEEFSNCQLPGSFLTFFPVMKALSKSLQKWVKGTGLPPVSHYPRIDNGTLVAAKDLKWPSFGIPHPANELDVLNVHRHIDYGPEMKKGIITKVPPVEFAPESTEMKAYKVLVPQTDEATGNEVGTHNAGIVMPSIAHPLATYAGWNIRVQGAAAPKDGCGLMASTMFFANTRAEAQSKGDSRKSREELYPGGRLAYLSKIDQASMGLVYKGFLLDEDKEFLRKEAEIHWDHMDSGSAPRSPDQIGHVSFCDRPSPAWCENGVCTPPTPEQCSAGSLDSSSSGQSRQIELKHKSED